MSPQASRQPCVTCPSISRDAPSRLFFGLPAWRARCSARFSSVSTIASHSVLTAESSFGNWVRVFRTFRISRLNASMAFVVYRTFRSAGPYSRNGMNRSHALSHTATAAGYFFPSAVPEKSASAA